MKRWIITAIYMAVMLVSIVGTSSAAINTPPDWGNQIGSFTYNGVEVGAYSNGILPDPNNNYFYPLHGTYGHQFQCVEYVNRFYSQALRFPNMGDPKTGLNLDAKNYLSGATSWGLVASINSKSKTPPQMGDIICSNGNGYNNGHVAIVRQVINVDVSPRSIRVIHQNWKNSIGPKENNYYNQEANYKELKMTKSSTGIYTVDPFGTGYPVSGWLHKP